MNNVTYQLAAPMSSQTTPFPNTVAQSKNDPNYCGAKTFSFPPSKTFVTGSDNIISVFTTNPADIGAHNNIIVTVSL